MSDPGSPPSSSSPTPRPPARNMADIARMFLDGVRPSPQNGAPQRISPQSRIKSTSAAPAAAETTPRQNIQPPADSAPASKAIENQKSKIENSTTLPPVMLALTGRDARHTQRLVAAANTLAQEHNTPVSILHLQNDSFTIDVAGLESPEDLPPVYFSAGPADMQIARTLFTLRHTVRHWIIAAPDTENAAFPSLAAAVADWLLIAATDNESVIASYQQLKRAFAMGAPRNAPRTVLISSDYAEAALIHARLRRAAKEFLKNDLPLAGVARNHNATALRIASISVGGAANAADAALIWSAVLDELCGTASEETEECETSVESANNSVPLTVDHALAQASQAADEAAGHAAGASAASDVLFDHLTNVLDPEEREALAADLYEEPMPVATAARSAANESSQPEDPLYDIRSQVAAPSVPEKSTEPKSVGRETTLRAFDLLEDHPLDRKLQWQSVERSIPDLIADSILLDARPPMSWATQSSLAVDPSGALHVWTLYKDGVSWFALREWATEHAALLALTRRDLVIAKDSPVAIHIVLPLEAPPPAVNSDISTLLRTPVSHVFLYRLRIVQWQARRGIIVVPIA